MHSLLLIADSFFVKDYPRPPGAARHGKTMQPQLVRDAMRGLDLMWLLLAKVGLPEMLR